jgi:Nitrile hydratase beta subunit
LLVFEGKQKMDGMHDLGGKQGFGPVRYTFDAPAFHAAWEVRANALYAHAVRLGLFNMDEYRHAIERMEPRHYVSASYYERTLTSLATLLVEKGVLPREDLERRAQGAVPLAAASAPGRGNASRPVTTCACAVTACPATCACRATSAASAASWSANHRPTLFRMRTRMAWPRKTSPRTTCAFAARICGPIHPTTRWCTSACSRVISKENLHE